MHILFGHLKFAKFAQIFGQIDHESPIQDNFIWDGGSTRFKESIQSQKGKNKLQQKNNLRLKMLHNYHTTRKSE